MKNSQYYLISLAFYNATSAADVAEFTDYECKRAARYFLLNPEFTTDKSGLKLIFNKGGSICFKNQKQMMMFMVRKFKDTMTFKAQADYAKVLKLSEAYPANHPDALQEAVTTYVGNYFCSNDAKKLYAQSPLAQAHYKKLEAATA